MTKYVDTKVTFSEIPDEVTLCINISNCPCHCPGCHSPYLAEDIGIQLDNEVLDLLLKGNEGITCVSFMGGDSNPSEINQLAEYVKKYHSNIKVAWYSGRSEISEEINIHNFDFIKIGPYLEEKGPLNNPNTNQRMYSTDKMEDITSKFWKSNANN